MELSNRDKQFIREAVANRLVGLRIKIESVRAAQTGTKHLQEHADELERILKKFST